MILKDHKFKLNFIILVLVSIFIFIIFIFLRYQNFSKAELNSLIDSQDLGYSTKINFTTNNHNDYDFQNFIKKLIYKMPNIISYKLNNTNFKKLEININFKNYKNLINDIDNAKSNYGVLNSPKFVKGYIIFNNSKYDAKFRVKGGGPHISSKRKFSLRIHILDGKTIFGYSKFSIHNLLERQYPSDFFYQKLSNKYNNLSTQNTFAKVYVNGISWGVMNVEEHMSTELLEKQKKKDSIIINISNDDKVIFDKIVGYQNHNYLRFADLFLSVNLYGQKKILTSILNRHKFSYLMNKFINKEYINLFESKDFIRGILLSSAWGNYHTLLNINKRLYLNPYTLKLEIITSDQTYPKKITNFKEINFYNDFLNENYLILNALKESDDFKNSIKKFGYIDNYINLENNLKDIYALDTHLFPNDIQKNPKTILSNIEYLSSKNELLLDDIFNFNLENKKNQKKVNFNFNIFGKHIVFFHYTNGDIEIYNLINDDLKVLTIELDKKIISINKIIPSFSSSKKPLKIKTNFYGINDNSINVTSEYNGKQLKHKNNISLIANFYKNPLRDENVTKDFVFLKKISKNEFLIKEGDWLIDEDVIINGNLTISPEVKLRFKENVGLIIKGSLNAIGKKENPIILKSDEGEKYWKGIYIFNAKKKSQINNVRFVNLKNFEKGLINLTGALSFYNSEVEIKNTSIENVVSEDAINLIKSNFNIKNLIINNTISDGVDFDFTEGVISDSSFSNIGGDAIDFSGSKVNVNNLNFRDIKDKSISVGEDSSINVNKAKIENSWIGIAVKDGSFAKANDLTIKNFGFYALMTYQKKDFYESPTLEVLNIDLKNNNVQNYYMRQTNSDMTVNGSNIVENNFDVSNIY